LSTRHAALGPAALERGMRLSVYDGMAYALMVGLGETYFLADAIRMGASRLEQGLVIGLPLCVGAAGPAAALWISSRWGARKPLVVAAALGQALVLLALALGDAFGAATPRGLIAAACVYQTCGLGAGTAWSSWYGDLVPAAVRGRYFAGRNRAVHLATCLGLVAGGLILQELEPARAGDDPGRGGVGFCAIFALACVFRLASVGLLWASPEPRSRGLADRIGLRRFLATQRGSSAWRQILLVALLYYAVYVASPYFGPFMLDELGFSYIEYMAAYACIVVLKVLFMTVWGKGIDAFGPRQVCCLAAILVALTPMPWLWADGLGWALFAQGLSGLSWAGFEVSQFSLLLDTTYKRTRLYVFAAQGLLNGLAQICGTLSGAALAALAGGELRALFAASLAGRLIVAFVFPRVLPAARGDAGAGHRALLLRMVGFRPSGGVSHRPLVEGEADVPASPPGGGDRSHLRRP
jgi:MFS family permease